jgi:plasmid stabilization system protein ParE
MSSSRKYPKELEVILTTTAEKRIREILNYVELNFGTNSSEKLLKLFIKSFNQISKFPRSGKESQKQTNHFQLVLNKQSSFYYLIENDKIYILTAFDNRMEEKKR